MKIYGDILERLDTVNNIVSITKSCLEMKNPITFSIEGKWGKGKTWIVEKVADSLEGVDIFTEVTKGKKKKNSDYLVFRYNAWEKDYYDEPILAILITIVNQLNKELILENIVKSELKELYEEIKVILEWSLRAISKRVIGVDVIDIGKHGFNVFKKIKDNAKINIKTEARESNVEKDIERAVKALNRLSKHTPIVFIVDELDRCLPQYAIKTLERLHHIFGKIESSVTIIAINEYQLKDTVKQMFGDDISFESYMRKFIDFRVDLNAGRADIEGIKIKLKEFFDMFGGEGDSELQNEIISNICGGMMPREFDKVCNNAILCHKLVGNDSSGFSKDCAAAELLLFACKIAREKEGNFANISPIYGNQPNTNLGKYIKEFLKKAKHGMQLDLTNSEQLVCFVCAKCLMLMDDMELKYELQNSELLSNIEEFYDEYALYYTSIKL